MEISAEQTHDVSFTPGFEKEVKAAMSMAVENVGNYYNALYREVHEPGVSPVGLSYLAFASSTDGVNFERSGVFSLSPTEKAENKDRLAVEDPTIVNVDGERYVFYSAVEPKVNEKGVLVSIGMVKGQSLDALNQNDRKIILTPERVGNELKRKVDMVKEPEFVKDKNGKWLMIYEVASDGVSKIAIAESDKLDGEYKNHRILIDTRKGKWDSQHISPGPLMRTSSGDILMFYNGRGPRNSIDQTPTWSIGSIVIDAVNGYTYQRAEIPIISPPEEIGPDGQLIAFSNSIAEVTGRQWLYYTAADKRMMAATLAVNNL